MSELDIDPGDVLLVMRPGPDGALYHRMENERFDRLLAQALERPGTRVVVLPRQGEQRERYRREHPRAIVPDRAVDAASLLALADVTIGAGGTMTRESAVLGTPTYTIFAGRLAGVDAELIRQGLLHDLRDQVSLPPLQKAPGLAPVGRAGKRTRPGRADDPRKWWILWIRGCCGGLSIAERLLRRWHPRGRSDQLVRFRVRRT